MPSYIIYLYYNLPSEIYMKISNKIIFILLSGFFLRLVFSFFGTLELDHNTFVGWSYRLVNEGFSNFYNGWSDYLPGYLYVLWFLGKLNVSFGIELFYKLPAIISDILTGYLIYKTVFPQNKKLAYYASVLYIFNPAIIANSTFWGQVDSFVALFSMLTIYFLTKNKLLFSAVALALGTLIKPQTAFAVPVVLWMMLTKKVGYKNFFVYVFTGALAFFLAFVPFFRGNLFGFAINRTFLSLAEYPYTSVNAFNFWAVFGMWKSDTEGIISLRFLGFVLAFVSSSIVLLRMRTYKFNTAFKPYFFLAGIMLSSFLFLTRIHERHMLPVFAPLSILSVFSPASLILYIGLSLLYIFNLYYSFVWIEKDFQQIIGTDVIKVVGAFAVAIFVFWLYAFNKKYKVSVAKKMKFVIKEKKVKFPKINKKINPQYALILVLAFSFLSRVYMLHIPEREYFDEVYHAFTARAMLNDNPKAWEWWNPNPEGYAYEWTHPPMAKLGMVIGMRIFGENAVGWRMPAAALGVGATYLIYLITKHLVADVWAGILAATAFSLDGLALVMSRIGMNDMYLVFFVLLSFYFFLKEKHLLSALALGLAASSKWSVMWFLPILGVSFFALRQKFKFSLLFYFILPPLIYVGSYIPMFMSGHGWDIFVEVQKQMWWYHTRLNATHAYTSPWWSWPFLRRPIWLYTSGESLGKIGNIYAMGNPVIFWSGVVSVIYASYLAFTHKSKKIGLIVFSYLTFFVTWAASPRIMFLYHYFPSVAFMSMAIGFTLRKHLKTALIVLPLAFIIFIYFYPHWTGIKIPIWLNDSYYWFDSWR